MTYNIRGGLGMDGTRSTTRIAQEVNTQRPDIVCFQEVHRRLPWSGFVDQPGRLQRLLGFPFVFQANLRLGLGGYGLGVAARYPVLSVGRHFLPSVREQRGALQVHLRTPLGALLVFCTHWGLREDERARQAEAVSRWVLDAAAPVIVCGDFNERPAAAAVRGLLARTGLRDADAAQDRPTYPADAPAARIDCLFHSPELRPSGVTVVPTPASDHLPLVVDFCPPAGSEERPAGGR